MICLFLLFRRAKRTLQLTYPSMRRLSRASCCEGGLRLMCGFLQISLISLSILLKLDFMQMLHVAYVVLVLASVGALFYLHSSKYRCITNLMTMLFLGRSGRALLITLLLTLVVSGVVQNLWLNSVEMVRVFVCTTLIHIRLAKMKFELLTTPFVDQFDEAIDSRKHLQDEVHRMTAFVQPAIEAVENPNPGFVPDNTTVPETQPMDPGNVTDAEYVDRYRGKLQSQCLFQIEETQRVCYRNYSYLYLDCVERVVLVQSFCDALKVEKYCSVSKIVSGSTPESFCNPADVVPAAMGGTYRSLVTNRNHIEAARSSGQVSYNITNLPTLPGIEEIKKTADKIQMQLERKMKFIDITLYILSFVDIIILLNLIISTLSYYRHYVMDISFDNCYVTEELRRMDKNRAESGKPNVLPLKHFERDFYVDPLGKQLRRREWFSISYSLLYIVLVVMGVSGLFLIDWVYYTGLDVVREHALVNYTQSGTFNFTLSVNGSGLLARLIRNATTGLNFTEFQTLNETNAKCLPNPTLTHWQSYVQVYLLAALILYMNVNLMYSKRMMSVVCGNYFPKKRQMRTKYLYNQMLIRRRVYFEQSLLALVEEEWVAGAHKFDTEPATDLEAQKRKRTAWAAVKGTMKTFGNWTGRVWQRVLEKIRLKTKTSTECSVCLEREEIAATGEFRPCGFDKCQFRYCSSCWRNLKERCVVYYAQDWQRGRPVANETYEAFMKSPPTPPRTS